MKKIAISSVIQRWDDKVPTCIDSILNQTYTNWEWYILASETSKPKIEEYVKNNEKVIVIIFDITKNVPRNKHPEIAKKGEYFFNLDGDDYLEPDCLAKLVKVVEITDVDIACCGVSMHLEETGQISNNRSMENTIVCKSQDYPQFFVKFFQYYRAFWGKLYKSSLFTDDVFSSVPTSKELGAYGGDTMSALALLTKTDSFAIVEGIGYHYMVWGGSVSRLFNENREKADVLLYQHIEKFLVHYDPNVSPNNRAFINLVHNNGIIDVLKVLSTCELDFNLKFEKFHYIITNEISSKTIPQATESTSNTLKNVFNQFTNHYKNKRLQGENLPKEINSKLYDIFCVIYL